MEYNSDKEALDAFVTEYKKLNNEIAKVIVGQDEVIRNVLISIFSNGHCFHSAANQSVQFLGASG